MQFALMVLLQTAPIAGADMPTFDIGRMSPKRDCMAPAGDEVVVCGSRIDDDRYRLPPLPSDRFEPKAAKAETALIGSARAAADVEQVQLGSGLTSNRIMVRFKLPF